MEKIEKQTVEQLTDEYCSQMGYLQTGIVRNIFEYAWNKGNNNGYTTRNDEVVNAFNVRLNELELSKHGKSFLEHIEINMLQDELTTLLQTIKK